MNQDKNSVNKDDLTDGDVLNIEAEANEASDENAVSAPLTEQTEKDAPPKPSLGFAYYLTRFGKAAWAYIKHARVELIVLAAVLALDLITKALVGKFMYYGQTIEVIPNFLNITYVRNTKAAFGSAFGLEKVLGDNAIRIIFLIITLIAMGVFSYILYRCRKRHFLMRLALALILAGALGNFIDRLVLRYVRDFVEIIFFGCKVPFLGYSFPVFNVADMGLTVGVIVFLVYFIAIYKEPKKKVATENVSAEPSEVIEHNDGDLKNGSSANEVADGFEDASEELEPKKEQAREQDDNG